MRTTRSLISALGLTTALLIGGAACSAEDVTNSAMEDAGIDGNISTGGDLPDGFPTEVATPELDLETGAAVEGIFTLRYSSDDSAADAAAYRTALEDAGFTPGEDFTFDEASGDYSGFTATSAEYSVLASAYGPDAPGGGNYLAVVVTPV
jgi:hypothetical protein